MDLRTQRRLFGGLCVVGALFSIFCVTDLMRESDQASILTGAWNLFRGASIYGQEYYNYDKHYIVYWLLAAAFRLRAAFGGTWSPVLIANISTAVTFWAATLTALLWRGGQRWTPPPFVLLSFLLTPSIFLNSTYANAAILSAGLILLASASLETRTVLGDALAAIAFFLAAGARGDAALLAPLLVWLRTPAHRWLRGACTMRATWMLATAGVGALALGEWLYSGPRQFGAFFDSTFHGRMLKTFAAYSVFGLGPSLLLLALLLALLVRSRQRRVFHITGALCVALPILYYGLQLYSPRYLVLAALSPMVFSLSRRGVAFWRVRDSTMPVPVLRRWIVAAAFSLLLVGIDAPVPSHPRLTLTHPTLFPTTDGLHPMGAWGDFMLKMRDASRVAIDHNQLLWKAAESARYESGADGRVHLFYSPMYSYLELAATLKGLPLKKDETDPGVALHSDSRSLMRVGSGLEGTSPATAALLAKPSMFVSDVYQGLGILRFNDGGDMKWSTETTLLSRLFAGNDYRLTNAERIEQGIELEGRPLVFLSQQPFDLSPAPGAPREKAQSDSKSGLYFIRLASRASTPRFQLFAADPARIRLAAQALPAWMSVGQ